MHKQLEEHFQDAEDVVFFHVQTVFEGERTNTPENGRRVVAAAGVRAPVGYDARVDGARVSSIMTQFGTGGTPWTIVIDKQGKVVKSGFTEADARSYIGLIEKLRKRR